MVRFGCEEKSFLCYHDERQKEKNKRTKISRDKLLHNFRDLNFVRAKSTPFSVGFGLWWSDSLLRYLLDRSGVSIVVPQNNMKLRV